MFGRQVSLLLVPLHVLKDLLSYSESVLPIAERIFCFMFLFSPSSKGWKWGWGMAVGLPAGPGA